MVIINISIWRRGKPETGISCYLSVLVFQGYCDKWQKTGQLQTEFYSFIVLKAGDLKSVSADPSRRL